MHFNAEARRRYLDFARSAAGAWLGNFRDLNGSITRLCTLATGGRITKAEVESEIARLEADWRRGNGDGPVQGAMGDDELLGEVLGEDRLDELDRFDRVQLAEVVRTCRRHRSLSAAGPRAVRRFARARKASSNDADRLRKYLARFDLDFATVG